MSAGVARGTAATRLGRWWQDWRFHLCALLILLPVGAFPSFYHLARLDTGEAGLGARAPSAVEVGPFALKLVEFDAYAPIDAGIAGKRKVFRLAQCAGCDHRIRAVHVRIGKPRSLRAAGAMFSGSPARQSADLAVPESARPDDGLWLTVEEWDGSVHKAEIPLAEVSPATADWLRRIQEKRK
ncbi:thiamine pyrophosphate-binding protein [Paracoccus aminovorans]|uniref:thiamine pyrophosphate-binding protein n=1 Tax=Paracoccus aminovorans TaxID=34004 RepID=UPI002B262A0C|nr:thiamine pyrophosphate-binding protein [Paracoccus aminovorans]